MEFHSGLLQLETPLWYSDISWKSGGVCDAARSLSGQAFVFAEGRRREEAALTKQKAKDLVGTYLIWETY